jgi:hypothetical protein
VTPAGPGFALLVVAASGAGAAAGCGERSSRQAADQPARAAGQEPAREAPAEVRSMAGGSSDRISVARYLEDLEFVARPRPPGSRQWQAVQDRCAAALEAAGFTVRRQAYATGVNVLGERRGATLPDELVVLGAHYDSTEGCPGADDNASGVAGALEAARVLGAGRAARTLVIACWDEEERGMIGSEAHARTLAASGLRPAVVYALEMIGFYSDAPGSQGVPPGFDMMFGPQIARLRENQMRGDFIALVHDQAAREAAQAIARHAAALELPVVELQIPEAARRSELFRDLRRSDHASFWDTGVPAIMVTDTADYRNPNYHCGAGPDLVADLDHDRAARVIGAVVGSVREQLGPIEP